MRVSEVMTAQVTAAEPDATIRSVGRMMSEVDSGVIPITQDGKVIGIITDRDIVIRAVAEGSNMDEPVSTIMTSDIQTCTQDDTVADAVGKMASHKIRRLVVTTEAGGLAGIVSLGDISKDYGAKQVGKTLEEISFAPPDQ